MKESKMKGPVQAFVFALLALGTIMMSSCGDKKKSESVRSPIDQCKDDNSHWDDRRRCFQGSYQEEIDRCTTVHRDNRSELDRCYRDVRRRYNTVDSAFDQYNNHQGYPQNFYDPVGDPFYNTEYWPTVYNPNVAIQPRDPWAAYYQQYQQQQQFYNQLYNTYGAGHYRW